LELPRLPQAEALASFDALANPSQQTMAEA
jgi:hypothetical protein